MTYHPDRNPTALPPIKRWNDVKKLPWGGNAWWDLPIMEHVHRFAFDKSFSKSERRKAVEVAGNLMTGEDCRFTKDYTFDKYLRDAVR